MHHLEEYRYENNNPSSHYFQNNFRRGLFGSEYRMDISSDENIQGENLRVNPDNFHYSENERVFRYYEQRVNDDSGMS